MPKPNGPSISLWTHLTSPIARLAIVFVLIISIGLPIVHHYGISWDEEATLGVVDVNYEIITQSEKNNHRQYHRQYYGTWFNVAAEVVFKGQQILAPPVENPNPDAVLLTQLKSKHYFTFLFSLITYGAAAGIVSMLAGRAFAWLGPLILWLIPRFWGNSFFNPKDIPLAAMFTLGTLLGACLIRYYFAHDRRQAIVGINRFTGYSILYGILVGFVAGTRIDSSVLILYVILVDVGLQLGQGDSFRQVLRFCRFYGLMLFAGVLTIILLYPASWVNPLDWYLAAFNFYYKEDWPHTVLFNGVSISAKTLPWQYLPTWISITTPIIVLMLFAMGLVMAILKFSRLPVGQRACLLLVGLQIFGLPVFAIIYQAHLWDSLRQVLYMLPGIAAIAAVAVAWLYQTVRRRVAKLALVSSLIVLLLPIAIDMAALHPYEYVYFNRAFGGLPAAAQRFDTDYWGLSMADAVIWLNQHRDRNLPLVSTDPMISAQLYADETLTVISHDDFAAPQEPFYYLSLPRWGWDQQFAECPVIYGTTRQQVPLAIVKQCN